MKHRNPVHYSLGTFLVPVYIPVKFKNVFAHSEQSLGDIDSILSSQPTVSAETVCRVVWKRTNGHMSLDSTNEKAQRPNDESKPKPTCGRESFNQPLDTQGVYHPKIYT